MKKLFYILIVWSSATEAALIRENFQSVRGTGMGNAYIAMADDGNCLWANPAGLAFNRGFHFNLFDGVIGFDSLDTLNRMKNLVFSGDTSNLVSTSETYMMGSFRPSILTRMFGISFYNHTFGYYNIQDLTIPEVEFYSYNDLGVIIGVGIPVTEYIGFGVSGRLVQRTGVDATFTAAELVAALGLGAATDFLGSVYTYLGQLSGTGYGVGFNFGFLAKIPLGTKSPPRLHLAATIEDLGNTVYLPLSTTNAPPQSNMSFNLGAGVQYYLKKNSYFNATVELRHILEDENWVKKLHLGIELKTNVFSFRAGLHQLYPTGGISFELLPHTKLHFSTFASEMGTSKHERYQRWYMLQATIGFNPM